MDNYLEIPDAAVINCPECEAGAVIDLDEFQKTYIDCPECGINYSFIQ